MLLKYFTMNQNLASMYQILDKLGPPLTNCSINVTAKNNSHHIIYLMDKKLTIKRTLHTTSTLSFKILVQPSLQTFFNTYT